MRVSAVVPAYNEERNVRALLDSVITQKTRRGELLEVVVVASGCTDGTAREVQAKAALDPRVRLLVQDVRLGKTAALNAYIRERAPEAEAVLISSADILLQPGFLDLLLEVLEREPTVGMCGGRPVPINSRETITGRMVGFLWDLHHEISLQDPKLGEAVVVRASLLTPLPEESPVDEASIEAHVTKQGYRLRYVPEAVIVNRGPDSVREFARQRRRIACGHYWVRATSGYTVSTLNVRRILRLALRYLSFTEPATDFSYLLAMLVEALARGVGYLDLVRGYRRHAVWKVAPSAHQAIAPPAPPGRRG